jgi:hypothetical protein
VSSTVSGRSPVGSSSSVAAERPTDWVDPFGEEPPELVDAVAPSVVFEALLPHAARTHTGAWMATGAAADVAGPASTGAICTVPTDRSVDCDDK